MEDTVYIVAWTGGYEAPSYKVFRTDIDAWRQAYEWNNDLKDGDTIDVLKVNLWELTIERLYE